MENPFEGYDPADVVYRREKPLKQQPVSMGNPFGGYDPEPEAQAQPPQLSSNDAIEDRLRQREMDGMSKQSASGIGAGMVDPFLGVSQLAAHALPIPQSATNWVDKVIADRETRIQAERQAQGESGLDTNRLIGNIASPANLMAGSLAGKLGSRAAGAVKGAAPTMASFFQPIINGSASAAATTPVTQQGDYWSDKGTQAGAGAIAGTAAKLVGSGVSRVLSPKPSEAVQQLMEAGVKLTPGQRLGGFYKRAEDAATSIPGVGDAIRMGQRDAIKSFNRAAIDEALAPVGAKLPGNIEPGREAVNFAKNTLGQGYDDVLSKTSLNGLDKAFTNEIGSIRAIVGNLPKQQQKVFDNVINGQIRQKISKGFANNNGLDGQTIKGISSELRRIANGYQADPSFDNRQLGQAIDGVQESFKNLVARANPEQAKTLSSLDRAYAGYKRIETAAGAVGSSDGVFTPAQFQSAVRKSDKSLNKNAFARGNALMQDLSDAGKNALPSSVPDSGTATRAALGLGVGGGALGLGVLPAYIAATGGAYGLYSPLGQRLMQSVLTSRPALVSQAGDAIGAVSNPFAAALSSPLARLLLENSTKD
jgi:hypothetical protein